MQNAVCKYCRSADLVKHGSRAGVQRYLCKSCSHHFYDNTSEFPKMRVNSHAIVTALNLYFEGLSTRKVARQLEQIYGEAVSQSTIWYWIDKYSQLVSDYVNSLTPQLSGSWHGDELFVKLRKGIDYKQQTGIGFLWNILDHKTQFLLASKLSPHRDDNGAFQAFKEARANSHGQFPDVIFVDGAKAYSNIGVGMHVKGWNPQVIARSGINKPHANNNRIERCNGTLRERVKVQRGWKSMETPIAEGQRIHYNFVRPNSALDGMTPAQASGLEVKGWKQLIENAQAQKTQEEVETKKVVQTVEVSVKAN